MKKEKGKKERKKIGLIVKTNGEVEIIKPLNKQYFTMDEIENIIGGHIQFCKSIKPEYPVMIIDEEGKLKGKPINTDATSVYDCRDVDNIVGDVLLCKADDIERREW